MNKTVTAVLGIAVFFILAGSLLIPSYEDTQGEISDTLESVTSESLWNGVINDSGSSDYTVNADDTVTLQNSTGVVQTDVYDSGSHDRLEVYAEQSQGTTDVVVYDASDDSQIGSTTLSGDSNDTVNVDPYSADSYYLEFSSTDSTTDSTLEEYTTTGYRAVDSDVETLLFIVLVLFLIGLGLGVYSRMT